MITAVAYAESIQDKLTKLGIAAAVKEIESYDFELEDLNGNLKTLSSYRGKFVFLNFWATWCGPCRVEMPSMQRMYDELKDEGLEIIAVDIREDQKTVSKFMKDNNLTFPVLLDRKGQVSGIYGVRSIPTTYLINKDGNIIGRAIGAREWDTVAVTSVFRELLQYDVAGGENDYGAEEVIVLTGEVKNLTVGTYSWGFTFTPPTIRKGDRVRITVKGIEGTHGVAIPELNLYTGPIKKGKQEVLEFIAHEAGTYIFGCNIPCGSGHMKMRNSFEVIN
jgi:thiol-disulfide isomerase/thioredoxin